MMDVEPLIISELERILPLADGRRADWADVLQRADARREVRRGRLIARRPGRERRWRPVLVAAVIVAALAGAGVAIAAGLGAFEGTPPPPPVSADFGLQNRLADSMVKQGAMDSIPRSDVDKLHGVIEIQTPDGPEDLWAAPNDQGGQCYFIDFANDPAGGPNGGIPGYGGCSTSADADSSLQITPDGPWWFVNHPDLLTIDGRVAVDAASVEVTLHDGSTLSLPVVEHFFLASIPKPAKVSDARLEKITAFDAAGNQVARWPFSQP